MTFNSKSLFVSLLLSAIFSPILPSWGEELATQYSHARGNVISGPQEFDLYPIKAKFDQGSPSAKLISDGKGHVVLNLAKSKHLKDLTLAEIKEIFGECIDPDHDYGIVHLKSPSNGSFEIRFVFKRVGGDEAQKRPVNISPSYAWGSVLPDAKVTKFQVVHLFRGMSDWIIL